MSLSSDYVLYALLFVVVAGALFGLFTSVFGRTLGSPMDDAAVTSARTPGGAIRTKAAERLPDALALVLMVAGLLGQFYLTQLAPDRLINPAGMVWLSVVVAAIPFGLFVSWVRRRVWRRQSRHPYALATLLMAAIGLVSVSFIALRGVNMAFDGGYTSVKVSNVRIGSKSGGEAGRKPHLRFSAANPRLDSLSPARIDDSTRDRLLRLWGSGQREHWDIHVYPGVLGFEWIDVRRF